VQCNVLPLDDRKQERLLAREIQKKEQKSYTFYPGTVRVPAASAPHVKNRSHSITAVVDISSAAPGGPIYAIGGVGLASHKSSLIIVSISGIWSPRLAACC
jgi:arylsulfatase